MVAMCVTLQDAAARSTAGAPLPWSHGSARAVLAEDARVVRARLRRADAGAGGRLAGDRDRRHVLIQAPTGSGKTLAAFLYGIDRLDATPGEGLRLLYVSPLKALNYDVERNLRGPLAGLQSELRVGVRTGDTPQKERAAIVRSRRTS